MDAEERQRLVAVIKSFADSINHSRSHAEMARLKLQNMHLASEEVARSDGLQEIEEEIDSIN